MSFKRTLIASFLMIFTAAALHYLSHAEDIHLNKPLSTFPKQIGAWVGSEAHFDKEIYDMLGVDDSLLCNYRAHDGRQINLYIGFYQSQRHGSLIHSPKHCMPGAGWNIIRTSHERLMIPQSNPAMMEMIKLVLQKGNQKQVVLYWFQSRGRFISSEYMQKVYLVIDSITRHRTDGSFVRLVSPVFNADEIKTTEYMKHFAKLVLPVLQEYIPS